MDTVENLLFIPSFEADIEVKQTDKNYSSIDNNSLAEFNVHKFSKQNPLGFFGEVFEDKGFLFFFAQMHKHCR